MAIAPLNVHDHSRDILGLRYVYLVRSRRSGGLSLGLNLSPNQACNWRCVYCQVPNLVRGRSPSVAISLLHEELNQVFSSYLEGLWGNEQIQDIAFSGDGEPTSCPNFLEAVEEVIASLKKFDLSHIPLVCISNGSFLDKKTVRSALSLLGKNKGSLWFKLDRSLPDDILMVNQVHMSFDTIHKRLRYAASCLPVWIQTCFFLWDNKYPTDASVSAYLDALQILKPLIQGVRLYGVARQPMLPEGVRVGVLPQEYFIELAQRIESLGITVQCSP